MTTTVSTKFHEQSQLRTSATTGASETLYAFHGPLKREIAFDSISTAYALWVVGGVRGEGEVDVTITYTTAPSTTYTVSAGRPLVIETQVGEAGLTVAGVKMTPKTSNPDVEFAILRSARLVAALPPENGAIVKLSSLSGVTTDGNGVVSWTPEAGSTATDSFDAILLSQPQYIESDPEFNGRPSLEFDGTDQRLAYSGAISDFDQIASGPFTIAIIHKPDDEVGSFITAISCRDSDSGVGIDFLNEYMPQMQIRGEGSVFENWETQTIPLPKVMVTIIELTYTTPGIADGGTYAIYNQGKRRTGPSSIVSTLTVQQALTIGAYGATGGNEYKGKIADVRVWDHQLTTDERESYLAYAEEVFGVDNTLFETEQYRAQAVLSAQRGWTEPSGVSPAVWIPYGGSASSFASTVDLGPTRVDATVEAGQLPYKKIVWDGTLATGMMTDDDESFYGATSGTGSFTIVCVWEHYHAQDGSLGYVWDSASTIGANGRQGQTSYVANGDDLFIGIQLDGTAFYRTTDLKDLAPSQPRSTIVDYNALTRELRIYGQAGLLRTVNVVQNTAKNANKMVIGARNRDNTPPNTISALKGAVMHWEYYPYSFAFYEDNDAQTTPYITQALAWCKARYGVVL